MHAHEVADVGFVFDDEQLTRGVTRLESHDADYGTRPRP
jgi:hypothetical protein